MREDRKTIVPTLVIGLGGTGLEVISRVRRLIRESYGDLANFPIAGFLHIDTDREAKPSNPLMSGDTLEASEKYLSQVALAEAQKIVHHPEIYPWYHQWLPTELINNPRLLVSETGAGQIRACGRFSLFFNCDRISDACQNAKRKICRGENIAFMSQNYSLQVKPKLNIFVVCSIAGGTGSGMVIDLGYLLQRWFEGEQGVQTTAIISTPDGFSSISANDRVKCNGYAALMELNYYCDQNTTFSAQYGVTGGSAIESQQPPYDYIYLTGTTNEHGVNLTLDAVRESMAQNIFLDLVSDFSAYKRSIRDNIVRAAAGQNDLPPQGRSYPRNFMSFGIATVEVPIHHIRHYLAYLLATDLCKWWLNSSVPLPVEPQTIVYARLRSMNLLGNELRRAILQTTDRSYPYQVVIQQWLGKIRQEITTENLLECRADGVVKVFSRETGQILEFVDGYLRPKVEEYLQDHLREPQNDERTHGDFFKVIYDNRDRLINQAIGELQERLYTVLVDRNLGLKFLQLELDLMEDSFERNIAKMEREAEKTWLVVEQAAWQEYEAALFRLHEYKDLWGLTKQSKINQECDLALNNLGQALNSLLERKSRIVAVGILRRLKEYLVELRHQLNIWQQRVSQSQAKFQELANQQANKADALEIVGEKLFERARLNEIYEDFLTKTNGDQEANLENPAQRGLEVMAQQLSQVILNASTSLWQNSRRAQEVFRLLDIEKIPEIQYPDFEKIVYQHTLLCLEKAGVNTKLYQDADACTRFMQRFSTEADRDTRIRELFEQSQPLVRLDRNIPQSSQFNYINLAKAGLIGGDNPTEIAAIKQVEILRKYFSDEEAIAPITTKERHKILAVQEVGGFSLRCLQGTEQLRRAYQNWRGQRIMAERARLRGQQVDLPPSVHLQQEIIFWDFIPPNKDTEKIVLILRTLEILKSEINQNTKQNVICYSTINKGKQEKVTLASNWENAVQVLELPDCRRDRQELERKLAEKLEAAETPKLKQELSQKLKSYLEIRLRDFSQKGGQDNLRYLREQDMIRDFMDCHKLA
ncbi:tubulin-like doman-containing protein [Pleurocapsa sp. PCC 7319]|uniref:tubulin-like doman-containing protein n=1 Tax=Pleurocapsa sp. PCC 7319 TaxID=118161 RepID=UPI00034665D5|nr:tubulin-like doman-containing protein [Pleurocapsa sp. PCC 7319]